MNNNFLPYQLKKNSEQANTLATQMAQKTNQTDIPISIVNPPAPYSGAKGDGVTDDTTAIQNLLNNFKSVIVPAKTFKISKLMINDRQSIIGSGKASVFQSIDNNTNSYMLETTSDANLITIENIMIDGNNSGTALTGIHLTRSSGTFNNEYDSYNTIESVYIKNMSGSGLIVDPYSREVRVKNLWVRYVTKKGLVVNTTDGFYTNISVGSSGEEGIYITSNNNKFSNVKTFVNGYNLVNCGSVTIAGDRNVFAGLEIQDAYYDGLLVKGTQNVISSLLVDGCGMNDSRNINNRTSKSIYITNRDSNTTSFYNNISGVIYNASGTSYGKYGLYIDSNLAFYNMINVSVSSNKSVDSTLPVYMNKFYRTFDNYTNRVIVNQMDYTGTPTDTTTTYNNGFITDITGCTSSTSNGTITTVMNSYASSPSGYSARQLFSIYRNATYYPGADSNTYHYVIANALANVTSNDFYAGIYIDVVVDNAGTEVHNKIGMTYNNAFRMYGTEYENVSGFVDLSTYSLPIKRIDVWHSTIRSSLTVTQTTTTSTFTNCRFKLY